MKTFLVIFLLFTGGSFARLHENYKQTVDRYGEPTREKNVNDEAILLYYQKGDISITCLLIKDICETISFRGQFTKSQIAELTKANCPEGKWYKMDDGTFIQKLIDTNNYLKVKPGVITFFTEEALDWKRKNNMSSAEGL